MIRFGPFRIDEHQHLLYSGALTLKLEKLPFELLLLLIRERHRTVPREEIADAIWGPGKFVEADDGINTAIRKIRRALDDHTGDPHYIQTAIGRGYRFIADVEIDPEPQPSQIRPLPRKPILAIAAVLLAILGAWALIPKLSAPHKDAFVSLARITSDNGYTGFPDISADGNLLAYASNRADVDNLDIYIQPAASTQAIRLTNHPARDITPAISPKGDQVAFQSFREPAGIYTVPLLGGEARLLVLDGIRPRYSPDGQWIAYTKTEKAGGGPLGAELLPDSSSWIIPAAGGAPRQLRPDLITRNPIWAGNALLILTGRKPPGRPGVDEDWWLTPLDGSTVKKLGVYAELGKNLQDIPNGWNTWTPSYFERDSIVFSARTRDGANLWRIPVNPDWTPQFPPQRVTMMNDHVRDAAVSADGRIVAAIGVRDNDVYELPIDTNSGTVKGPIHRLTRSKTNEQFASISADGNLVAYTSWRTGDPGDLYLLDRRTGLERQLTDTPEWESFPRLSPDGRTVLYKWFQSATVPTQTRRLFLDSGTVQTLCNNCRFMDQTADGKSFLYGDTLGQHIFVRDFTGGPSTEPVADPALRFTNAHLDAANRWIAFVATAPGEEAFHMYAAPYRRNARLSKNDFVPIATGLTPTWSPNGHWLYFEEKHGSYNCLWAQQFDPVKGHPVGEKREILHIHGDQRLIQGHPYKDRGVAHDRIVFSLSEETSNIWLMR